MMRDSFRGKGADDDMGSEPTKEEIRAALAAMRRAEMKETVRMAIKEWLSEQLAIFGWWTTRGLMAIGLSLLLYLALLKAGWVPPNLHQR